MSAVFHSQIVVPLAAAASCSSSMLQYLYWSITYVYVFITYIRIGWNKFRQLVPLLTNKDVSLIMRGRLYSSCVGSSMLHGSETWPVRKENVATIQRAEMRMVRWRCGVKLKDRLPSKELRERLRVDDIALVLQQNRLRWYGHVLR